MEDNALLWRLKKWKEREERQIITGYAANADVSMSQTYGRWSQNQHTNKYLKKLKKERARYKSMCSKSAGPADSFRQDSGPCVKPTRLPPLVRPSNNTPIVEQQKSATDTVWLPSTSHMSGKLPPLHTGSQVGSSTIIPAKESDDYSHDQDYLDPISCAQDTEKFPHGTGLQHSEQYYSTRDSEKMQKAKKSHDVPSRKRVCKSPEIKIRKRVRSRSRKTRKNALNKSDEDASHSHTSFNGNDIRTWRPNENSNF